MSASNDLRKELGGITSDILTKILTGVFPDLRSDIQSNPLLLRLAEGDFSVHEALTSNLKKLARNYLINVGQNPFVGDIKEITRTLVGSTIVRISSPGKIEAALITSAAGYQNDGFPLGNENPGTWGVWKSSQRGEYHVSCIASHNPDEHGYIAIFGATSSDRHLKMNDFTQTFSPEGFEGRSIVAARSPLKVMMRESSERAVTGDLEAYAAQKKGKNCVAAYELASNKIA